MGWAVLGGIVDDAPLDPMCARARNTEHVEEPQRDGLEHALFTAMEEIALLDEWPQIHLVVGGLIGVAVIVLEEKAVVVREVQLPRVLAHSVAPYAATSAVAHVIIDVTIVDDRAGPVEYLVAVPTLLKLGVENPLGFGDELIDGESAHDVGWECLHLS